MKEIIDKLDFIKNFCSVKDSFKRMRRQAIAWVKILAKGKSDKGLLSRDFPGGTVVENPPANAGGTRVRFLVREDPLCCGATKPVCHNY